MVLFFVSAAEKDSVKLNVLTSTRMACWLITAAADSSFCLKYDDNGVDLCLDTVHPYYY